MVVQDAVENWSVLWKPSVFEGYTLFLYDSVLTGLLLSSKCKPCAQNIVFCKLGP